MTLGLRAAMPYRPLYHRVWRNPTEPRAEYVAQVVNREVGRPAFFKAVRHARLTVRIGLPGARAAHRANRGT
jgi:hypothetical protein